MKQNVRTILKLVSEKRRHKEHEAHEKILGRVSVCVPNYNKGRWIFECLKSIALQSYKNIEIVVVDDCSSDNSINEIMRFKSQFHQIQTRVVQLPVRVGTAWAQNMAYFLARGSYVANMDSDDISSPFRIESQLKAIKEEGLDIVGTNFTIFKDDASNPEIKDGGSWLKYSVDEIETSYLINSIHCVCFGSLLMKYSVLEATGGMNKEYIGTEDFDFCLRAAQKGFVIGNIKEPLYFYRSNDSQRSTLFHSSSV